MLVDQLSERQFAKRAVADHTLIVAMIDDFPTFCIIISLSDRFTELGSQSAAAPEMSFEERLKAEGIENWLLGTAH